MNAPSAPSCENTACEPSFHSSWNIEPPGGLTAVAKKFLPNARASPVRTFATASTPGDLRDRVGGCDRDRVEVVLRRDRVVRVRPDLVHGAAERRRDPGGEQRDERDEREPDHQRGRSRRGPLRVAPRVVAGEPPSSAADLRRRPAEAPGERPDEPDRQHRDADEDQQRTDAHPDEHALRAEVLAEQAVEKRGEPGRRDDRRADRAEAGKPRRRQRRPFTHGRDRRHARGADRRPQARDAASRSRRRSSRRSPSGSRR